MDMLKNFSLDSANSTIPPTPETVEPRDKLIGHILPSGWKIIRRLPRAGEVGAEDQTGGHFSIGYIASKPVAGGKPEIKAFLKIIDIEEALKPSTGTTLMQRLKDVSNSHTFECTILDICQRAKLDRVVTILDKGELPALPGMVVDIPYILFELADGDVRKIVSRANKLEDAWRFRVLHDATVGIQQLHGQDIAHQDLKPSNVLIYPDNSAKVGDLGRASRRGMDADHDGLAIAGARAYAPPEQVYGEIPPRWEERRQGCDLYHLGSLAMFLFAGITPTIHYIDDIPEDIRPWGWNGKGLCDYATALPVLTASFTKLIDKIQPDIPEWAREEMMQILTNSCTPDFKLRGDPDARARTSEPLGIEAFVSRFDRLSKRAMVELKK